MANNVVDKLVAKLDEQTRVAIEARPETFRSRKLLLVGSEESRYLKGVAAKARKLGLRNEWWTPAAEDDYHTFPVFDLETSQPWYDGNYYDLDNMFTDKAHGMRDGMSCTAEACLWILEELKATEGVHVCMIGRGHAVKGLAERLLLRDATVTVCHSKTRDITWPSLWADVIINSAPTMRPIPTADCIVLDVSGGMERWGESNLLNYFGPRDIGRLNISILLNRFVNR